MRENQIISWLTVNIRKLYVLFDPSIFHVSLTFTILLHKRTTGSVIYEIIKTYTSRIINNSSPEFLHNLVNIKENSYKFRYEGIADIPRPKTTRYGKKNFSYEAAKLWNSLPNETRTLSTFGQFKFFISTWCFSEKCTCSSCK